MLFSGGACSRRVSLFKAVLFSAKMRKAQEREERERVGSWERAGEFCLRLRQCFVCGMPREGGRVFFLGNEEKERIFIFCFIFFIFIFFSRDANPKHTPGLIKKEKGERTEYYYVRTPFIYYCR